MPVKTTLVKPINFTIIIKNTFTLKESGVLLLIWATARELKFKFKRVNSVSPTYAERDQRFN